MGFEDRDYYQDSYQQQSFGRGFSTRSMIAVIIMINVAVFVLDMFSPRVTVPNERAGEKTVVTSTDGTVTELIEPETKTDNTQWVSRFLSLDSNELWRVWGFVTYGFAHASFMTKTSIFHILMNMLTLFFLGTPVEQRLGGQEFLRFYMAAVVVSGLGWLIWVLTFGGGGFMVGASGAVSAVTMYFVFMAPHSKILLMGVLPVPAWGVGVLFLFVNLSHALGPDNHIAWQAHMMGAAFGVLYFQNKWNLGRFDFGISKTLSGLFSGRPRLKVHDPGAAGEKLKAQADEILAKINEQGEESLTRKERKILNAYSKSIRKNRDN